MTAAFIERQKLIEDLKLFSVKKGEEFVLSSGEVSNIYVDVKQIMLYAPCMHNLAKLLFESSKLFGYYHSAAGVPLGGSILATMVAMYSLPLLNVVLIRKETKGHGTQKLLEAPAVFDFTKKVVLFEDVVTTGKSVLQAARLLEVEGFDIRGIMAVVDRRFVRGSSTLGEYNFHALIDIEELI